MLSFDSQIQTVLLDTHSVISNIVLRKEVSNYVSISGVHCAPGNDSQKNSYVNHQLRWFVLKP